MKMFEFRLARENTFWGHIDTMLVMTMLIALSLFSWGTFFNALVVEVNNGVMPVISSDFLMPTGGTPREFVDDGKLMLLADRFTAHFPDVSRYIPGGLLGGIANWWGTALGYEFEGGLWVVSLGDIFRWVGSLLFLFTNLLLVASIGRRFWAGDRPRMFKR